MKSARHIESVTVSSNGDGFVEVGLTEELGVEIFARQGGVTVRVAVDDTEELRQALFTMGLVQSERLYRAQREAQGSEPIDKDTRSAIFAGLAEVYGKDVIKDAQRERRLNILSRLAGRRIHSLSTWNGDTTMADAKRILDALSTLRDRA